MTDLLSNALGQMLGELLGESLETVFERRQLARALERAVHQAEARFAREYRAHDAELADVLAGQTRFADLPSVRAALRELLARPFHDPSANVATLRRSFADVLPERIDRARIDAAMAAFLGYLGDEVLYIPQLRSLYALAFHKSSAESSRQMAASTAAMAMQLEQLHGALRSLPAEPQPALPAPARPRPWHNLPQRSYARFVGRQPELEQLRRLLLPHPRSRHFVVTLDGIGGVGKSALALELAYGYRDAYAGLPPDERFAAIVWVSAKRTLLTAGGIQQREPTFSTLDDLYQEIAIVLDQPAILQAEASQRRGLIERALAADRTLLIVDNLETVDDEALLSFLRELPDPTKALVTTRHRIDIAYALRLSGMPEPDAYALMLVEAGRKNVELALGGEPAPAPAAMAELYRRTGGLPLAIVWSIGLMSLGYGVESVLRRLGSGHSDIARFCFGESVARIRDRDAYRLLLALALFEHSTSREMLGAAAGLGDDPIGRDDGLAELLQLSLVNQKGERFLLLPLTHSYALAELAEHPALERELRERWIAALADLSRPYADLRWRQIHSPALRREGRHLATLAAWCQRTARLDVLLQILPALAYYYTTTGQWSEILELSQTALEYARLTHAAQSIVFIEAHILAWMLRQQGRQAEAEAYAADALVVARAIGNPLWQCDVLIHYSQVLRQRRDFAAAEDLCRQALLLVPQLPPAQQLFVRADVDYELGRVARDRGEWPAAEQRFVAACAVFRHDEDNPGFNLEYAWSLYSNLGFVKHQVGELDTAALIYAKALAYLKAAGSKGHMTTLLVRLAQLEHARGDPGAALEYAAEALEWSVRLGMVQERAQAEQLLASLRA